MHFCNIILEPLDTSTVLFMSVFAYLSPACFLLWPLHSTNANMYNLVLSPYCFRPHQCFHAMPHLPFVAPSTANSSPTRGGKSLNCLALERWSSPCTSPGITVTVNTKTILNKEYKNITEPGAPFIFFFF